MATQEQQRFGPHVWKELPVHASHNMATDTIQLTYRISKVAEYLNTIAVYLPEDMTSARLRLYPNGDIASEHYVNVGGGHTLINLPLAVLINNPMVVATLQMTADTEVWQRDFMNIPLQCVGTRLPVELRDELERQTDPIEYADRQAVVFQGTSAAVNGMWVVNLLI